MALRLTRLFLAPLLHTSKSSLRTPPFHFSTSTSPDSPTPQFDPFDSSATPPPEPPPLENDPPDPHPGPDFIPIVSYPVAKPADAPPRSSWEDQQRDPSRMRSWAPSSAQQEQPEDQTSSRVGFSSGIIPPAYEPVLRRRVAPLPDDIRSREGVEAHDEQNAGMMGDSRAQYGHGAAASQGDEQVLVEEGEEGEAEKTPRRGVFVSEDDLDIPIPVFVKVETRKRPDPIVLAEAIRKVKSFAKANFNESVEAHVRLGVDPKRSDQLVRGAATLPHGIGKVVRVAVFADGEAAEEARSAGADVVGSDELVDMILSSGGKLNFDKCIATPAMMPKLSKVARILGPRGLMPNPKVGTVTKNVGNAVKHIKKGRVDFRADKTGIVHAGVGKVSFTEEHLRENIAAFANALLAAKPVGLKKTSKYAGYMINFSICSTMGPGVRVTIPSISQAVDGYTKNVELQ